MKKKAIVFVGVLIIAAVLFALLFLPKTETVRSYAMNTFISVTVKSSYPKKDADAAIEEVKRIDALMSVTRPSSELSRINSAPAGEEVEVSKEVYKLIEFALEISQKTEGAFDISINPLSELWDINSETPHVPANEDIKNALEAVNYKDIKLNPKKHSVTLVKEGMSINLGAIAKGYAADCVAKVLNERGVKEAIIDLGGNVYVLGREKRVGIQTPFKKRGEYFTVCGVADKSVVTSGAYERYFEENGNIYHHILNPKDGYPAESGIKSVSVICRSSALADGLSTAFYVMGEEKTRKAISLFDEVEVVILTDEDEVIRICN